MAFHCRVLLPNLLADFQNPLDRLLGVSGAGPEVREQLLLLGR